MPPIPQMFVEFLLLPNEDFLKWDRSDGCRIELRPVTGSTCTWMGFAVGDVFVWLFVSPPLLCFTPTSFIMTSHMGASWANW